jgi:hypothetical protein
MLHRIRHRGSQPADNPQGAAHDRARTTPSHQASGKCSFRLNLSTHETYFSQSAFCGGSGDLGTFALSQRSRTPLPAHAPQRNGGGVLAVIRGHVLDFAGGDLADHDSAGVHIGRALFAFWASGHYVTTRYCLAASIAHLSKLAKGKMKVADKSKIELLQDSWIKIWQIYMAWFSWHFGIQLFALGWIFSTEKAHPYVLHAAIFMAIVTALGVCASIQMAAYDSSVRARAQNLDRSDDTSIIFGSVIAKYAVLATAATNALMLLAWMGAAYELPSWTPQSN